MAVLSTLNRESKIALATMLLDSVAKPNDDKETFSMDTRFSGDWGKGKSADEIAEELRKSRTFNRTVETW